MGNSEGLVLIAVGLAALVVCIAIPRLLRRRDPSLGREGTFGETTEESEARLRKILSDIQEVSREHIAALDSKIRLMGDLLAECDRKKAELERLTEGRDASPPPPAEPVPPRAANPLHDQVYALQDAGRAVDDICAETGLEKGEVELILGLRRVPPAAGAA